MEDVVEYISSEKFGEFFRWLGTIGALVNIKGIILGKFATYKDADNYVNSMLSVINKEYCLYDLPIIIDMNFGHTSPMFILPFGALAEINCEEVQFSILESGVI